MIHRADVTKNTLVILLSLIMPVGYHCTAAWRSGDNDVLSLSDKD